MTYGTSTKVRVPYAVSMDLMLLLERPLDEITVEMAEEVVEHLTEEREQELVPVARFGSGI